MHFFIFSNEEKLLTILDNQANTVPMQHAIFVEQLNGECTVDMSIDPLHDDAKFIKEGNLLGFFDQEDQFQLFEFKDLEDENGMINYRDVISEHTSYELNDEFVDDVRVTDRTAAFTLGRILEGTRFEVGIVDDLGLRSTNFYRISTRESIYKMIKVWECEVRYRVILSDDGTEIAHRYVDLLTRRGSETGNRIERGVDLVSLRRSVSYSPKTALRGYGASLESGDGYGRKIDFKDIEWSITNGDPVDKPLGQDWVGLETERIIHGRPNKNGVRRHRFGVFEDGSIEEPEQLLQRTYEVLLQRVKVNSSYQARLIDLYRLKGYEHKKISLGDTNIVIDDEVKPIVELSTRIVELKLNLLDPEDNEATLGSFKGLFTNDSEADELLKRVKDGADRWDNPPSVEIIDSNFPDIKPETPQNVIATGGFQTIIVEWDFDGSSYIKEYIVYASEVAGFNPDQTNIVYKGKTSGYNHNGITGKRYYFRVRAVNYHGRMSDVSQEVSAQTSRIITNDMLFGSVNAEILADLAVTAEKLADGSVVAGKVDIDAIDTDNIKDSAIVTGKLADLLITAEKLAEHAVTTEKIAPLSITDQQIKDATIVTGKLADLAITAEKLADDSVNVDKIVDEAITEIKLAAGSVTNVKIADNAIDNLKIANDAVTKEKIADNAIGEAQIEAGAINEAKMRWSTHLLF